MIKHGLLPFEPPLDAAIPEALNVRFHIVNFISEWSDGKDILEAMSVGDEFDGGHLTALLGRTPRLKILAFVGYAPGPEVIGMGSSTTGMVASNGREPKPFDRALGDARQGVIAQIVGGLDSEVDEPAEGGDEGEYVLTSAAVAEIEKSFVTEDGACRVGVGMMVLTTSDNASEGLKLGQVRTRPKPFASPHGSISCARRVRRSASASAA